MSNNMKKRILLVGAGGMSAEYAKVLTHLQLDFEVVGRNIESCQRFENATNKRPIAGGLANFLKSSNQEFTHAIISVGVEDLFECSRKLIDAGFKRLLVEKPAGINSHEIETLGVLTSQRECRTYVGYNRRFFSSVMHAKRLIQEDGGITSFTFEFTEWTDRILNLGKSSESLAHLFLNNSSHVVDLAFHLGGTPKTIQASRANPKDWHRSGSIFVGAGETQEGTLFSYHANWDSAGRWGLELCSKNYRYILRPLEKLHIVRRNSVDILEVPIDDTFDKEFKPGLFLQVKNFLDSKSEEDLCTIEQHCQLLRLYRQISGED